MSKTKGISKKKKILKTLLDECIPFDAILIVFSYAGLGFINIPINFWNKPPYGTKYHMES